MHATNKNQVPYRSSLFVQSSDVSFGIQDEAGSRPLTTYKHPVKGKGSQPQVKPSTIPGADGNMLDMGTSNHRSY